MKFLKSVFIGLTSFSLMSCLGNNDKKTSTTEKETSKKDKTSEESGGNGGKQTPNTGGWPVLDKLPISGSLSTNKSQYFSSRAAQKAFITWKNKKSLNVKKIYNNSDQFQSDLNTYSGKRTKTVWLGLASATNGYNSWRVGSRATRPTSLKNTYKNSGTYTTKKANYVAAGPSKRNKATWFGLGASSTPYNTWRATRPTALKNAWEATTSGTSNFQTKLTTWFDSVKAASYVGRTSKNDWVDHGDSTNYYNTWRLTRPAALKTTWEATTSGTNNFQTKLTTWFDSVKAASYVGRTSKSDWVDHGDSTNYYNTWRTTRPVALKTTWEGTTSGSNNYENTVDTWFNGDATFDSIDTKAKWLASGDAALKTEWEKSADFLTKVKASKTVDEFLDNAASNSQVKTYFYSIRKSKRKSLRYNKDFRGYRYYALYYDAYFAGFAIIKSDGGRFSQGITLANFNKYFTNNSPNYDTQIQAALDKRLDANSVDFKYNLNLSYKTLNSSATIKSKTDFITFAKAAYKASASYNTDFATWKGTNSLTDTAYKMLKSNKYKENQTRYNTGLDAWSVTKANGKAKYKDAATSATDYLAYKKVQYKLNKYLTAYNTGLDAWSITKANGKAKYKDDATSATNYLAYKKVQYKLNKYSTAYNAGLDAWSSTKANGQVPYFASAASTTAYNTWVDPLVRTAAQYDANDRGQFNTDMDVWSSTKANGFNTYKSDNQSELDYGTWRDPNKNAPNSYKTSGTYTTNFNNFVSSLTVSDYKEYLESDAFTKEYNNFILGKTR